MAKGPKTLNPADKARKEARKKELKKNKKQRQQVRSAAIECRDPHQIVAELELLDKQEFDIDNYRQQTSSGRIYSDILFKDKRKRLKELYAKILAHYEKEDSDKHAKLKALEVAYEAKHRAAQRNFEAVRAAQQVKIEDVFLPPDQSESETKPPVDVPAGSGSQIESVVVGGQLPDFKQLLATRKGPAPATFASSRFLPANQRKKVPPAEGRFHPADRAAAGARQVGGQPQAVGGERTQVMSKPSVSEQPEQIKPAVIESKPVIFVPKITKFVPASVRSKLGAKK